MKKFILSIAILATAAVAGCNTQKNSGIVTDPLSVMGGSKDARAADAIGGERDEHGCLTSAGYIWSVVRNDCVRPWEAGVKLASATDPNVTQATYVIFSDDSARAEVFVSGRKGVVLTQSGKSQVWSDGKLTLVRDAKGSLSLIEEDRTIFKS